MTNRTSPRPTCLALPDYPTRTGPLPALADRPTPVLSRRQADPLRTAPTSRAPPRRRRTDPLRTAPTGHAQPTLPTGLATPSPAGLPLLSEPCRQAVHTRFVPYHADKPVRNHPRRLAVPCRTPPTCLPMPAPRRRPRPYMAVRYSAPAGVPGPTRADFPSPASPADKPRHSSSVPTGLTIPVQRLAPTYPARSGPSCADMPYPPRPCRHAVPTLASAPRRLAAPDRSCPPPTVHTVPSLADRPYLSQPCRLAAPGHTWSQPCRHTRFVPGLPRRQALLCPAVPSATSPAVPGPPLPTTRTRPAHQRPDTPKLALSRSRADDPNPVLRRRTEPFLPVPTCLANPVPPGPARRS